VIKLKHEFDKATTVLYKYLLICTRLNMTSDRIHDNEDGALLFEELIADVIKNYLGSTRAKSLVFGTAASGNFKDKVNTLCELVDEGATYRRLDVGKEEAKDGKLDVVGLIPFSDKQPGKLIVFAQCKTGTSWRDQITQLQPEAFCKKWMTEIPRVIPIRALCLCELVNKGEWNHLSIDAGILFDRCRIMDFSDALNSELVARIEKWVKAAEEKIKDML
jgi:hypothetical protein